MSESSAAAPKPGRRTSKSLEQERQPGQKREDESGEFECRRVELALVLAALDRELWKRGIAAGNAPAVDATGRKEDDEERRRVKEVTGTMFAELQSRLAAFADACARLGDDERASLAVLLRLPEARRRAIGAILRLSERERSALRVTFALSEAECHALAELLRPMPVSPAEGPSITIIDPSVLAQENEAEPPSVT
jgi:hypothetical protein